MSERHIDHQIRRVDDAFSTLRPGRELDERLEDLLDGRAAPPRPLWTRLVPAAVALLVVTVVIATADAAGDVADAASVTAVRAPAPGWEAVGSANAIPPDNRPGFAGAPAPAEVPSRPALLRVEDPAPGAGSARDAPVVIAQGERELLEDARFIEVPLGKLEVRAPSVVEVRAGSAIVTSGSARLFERGKQPRTLQEGQSIAWRAAIANDVSEALPPATAALPPATKDEGLGEGEIEAAFARARAQEAKGAYAEAADLLGDLLARRPPTRVADTVAYERAMLLARAQNLPDACLVLADHARRFPASENANDVAAARVRFTCR